MRTASVDLDLDSTSLSADLRRNIDALAQGTADETVLRRLAVICAENGEPKDANGQSSPVFAPASPTSKSGIARPLTSLADVWLGGRMFDRLFDALTGFLTHDKVRCVCQPFG